MKKPDSPFPRAAETELLKTRNDSTSSYQSATGTKKRKAYDLNIETTQLKQRPSGIKKLKTGTNTNTSDILGVKRPPSRRHVYVGRLRQHISVTEIEEYCKTNGIELIHFRKIS